jgi:2-C-methyl-D-erythritol 4-phosphate cytidylyltransferase
VWTIVLAAGSGSRFGGDQPKQYVEVGGRRLIDWSLEAARRVSDGVVLVVDTRMVSSHSGEADLVVAGGARRSDSVRAALEVIPETAEVIVVHDSARPLASVELFDGVIERLDRETDGVVPAVPVTDTIKVVAEGVVVETLDRSRLVAVQTPQAFRAEVLRRAHEGSDDATDDAALVEASGGRIAVVSGEASNVKVTHPGDLVAVERLLG